MRPAVRVSDDASYAVDRFAVDPAKVRHLGPADIDIESDAPLPRLERG